LDSFGLSLVWFALVLVAWQSLDGFGLAWLGFGSSLGSRVAPLAMLQFLCHFGIAFCVAAACALLLHLLVCLLPKFEA